MRSIAICSLLLSSLSLLEASSIRRAAAGVASVDLSKATGDAKFLASGWIYGFPDNGTSADTRIPANYITDVKFGATRAGGAQTPSRGWIGGYKAYLPRFQSALSNYRTARKYGGTFILLVHDLWGADGGSIPLFPGDNNDWTQTDAFLNQLVSDIKANDMLDGLVLDIWNEPDGSNFWARSWDQYLSYYVHAHKYFKSQLPTTLVSGPSAAHSPGVNDAKWKAWLKSVSGNKTIPDFYSWHQIGDWEREPDRTIPDFKTMKAVYNMPDLPIHVNEYAWPSEQQPAGAVFFISQLERYNIRGLRANWGSGSGLHDTLANLVGTTDKKTYYPNGEWQLYKYYANMIGTRVATTASTDHKFDVFATKSGNLVKIIAGTRGVKAAYDISITGLSSVGLSDSGSVAARVYRFDWAGANGRVDAPVDMGTKTFTYSGGKVTINVDPATNSTAYAYEFTGKAN